MALSIIKLFGLLAIFACVFLVIQQLANAALTSRFAQHTVNRRLKLLQQGLSREAIAGLIHPNYMPAGIARDSTLGRFYRMVGRANIGVAPTRLTVWMGIATIGTFAALLFMASALSTDLTLGVLVLLMTVAVGGSIGLPIMFISQRAHRRSRKMEEQFPNAIDIFTRALRSGHPVGAAINLLTTEMEDPLGSEFGIVADEIAYGSDLNDSLRNLALRWDLEYLRMFAVCISVQTETGGNLAEILSNLSGVIRDRASLYLKVRALSSEGRMSAWMLTALPVLTFLVLFSINPEFYLDVAQDPIFTIGFVTLLALYLLGVFWIRKMVDLKV